MTALAAVPASNEPIPVKERRISKRLQEAIRLLSDPECTTQRAAAQKLGMSETYLSEALRKPEVQVFIARRARETVAGSMLKAANRVVSLMNAESEHVSADMSKHVLAIGGIKPTADAQVSVNIDIKAGYVIDLTDKPAAAKLAGAMTIEHDGSPLIK